MSTLIAERGVPQWKRRLTLPAYRVGDAARYAGISSQTILNWQGSTQSKQVIGQRDKGISLSYFQLVEVAFVAALRRAGMKLPEIKNAREYMAQKLKAEYPFAQHRFKTDGKDLWMELSEFDSSSSRNKLVKVNKGGQLAWAEIVEAKFTEFEYQDDLAVQWHVGGEDSSVLIDPRVSFGAPMINGVATWAIKGRWDAGESLVDIAEDFSLDSEEVAQALKFEGIDLADEKAWRH